MTPYEKIKEIYDRERLDIFVMATTHLLSIGWNVAQDITDASINGIEGNGLMSKEFCQLLVRLAREISRACSPVEFIQFCQVEKLYDTKGFKPRKGR